jgi:uncharacterized glyoxalase superfamily protein PhnB
MIMIGDVGAGEPRPGQLFLYVEDGSVAYERALQAGATSIMDPCMRPWGENNELMRAAAVKDPAGNSWFLAWPKEIAR